MRVYTECHGIQRASKKYFSASDTRAGERPTEQSATENTSRVSKAPNSRNPAGAAQATRQATPAAPQLSHARKPSKAQLMGFSDEDDDEPSSNVDSLTVLMA